MDRKDNQLTVDVCPCTVPPWPTGCQILSWWWWWRGRWSERQTPGSSRTPAAPVGPVAAAVFLLCHPTNYKERYMYKFRSRSGDSLYGSLIAHHSFKLTYSGGDAVAITGRLHWDQQRRVLITPCYSPANANTQSWCKCAGSCSNSAENSIQLACTNWLHFVAALRRQKCDISFSNK